MSSFFYHIGDWFATAVSFINGLVWCPALVVLCLAAGLYFSLRTRFVQVRRFGEMFRLLFGAANNSKRRVGISSFQAFALALSGRVGTGNIVGVATAIGFGGPGAVVWMWIIAFFGAGTAFAEATLAQIYKEKHNGQFRGGPAYYIEKGLHSTFFACLFAVFTALACGVCLPPLQCNGVAISCARTFGLEPWMIGAVVALLIALVIIGGVRRIAQVAQIVAPFMAFIYIVLSIVVLAVNYDVVPDMFMQMLRGAVGVNQVGGAILGTTIAMGVKRGIFSNEAGQGTGPIIAAAATVNHPVKQGLVQAFSVYIDTLLVCTATALMILACKTYNIIDSVQTAPTGETVVTYLQQNANAPAGEPGVFYTSSALGTVVGPKAGDIIVSVALFFFVFTTIMAYYYYAETNIVYLFSRWRRRRNRPEFSEDDRAASDKGERLIIWILRCVTVLTVFAGSLSGSGSVWTLGDIGVGLMAWINILAILLLSSQVLRALNDYERQKSEGREPVFHPQEFGISNADFWEEE